LSSNGAPPGSPAAQAGQGGLQAQDTAELFFGDTRVPARNLLGDAGGGLAAFMRNLPRERIGIAVAAQCSARRDLIRS